MHKRPRGDAGAFFCGVIGVIFDDGVYEPPASRFARRVPLLLTQKGEGARGHPADGECRGGSDDGEHRRGGSRTSPFLLRKKGERKGVHAARRVYEPPASRFARRVPLLLAQKGEGRLGEDFEDCDG